MINFGRTLQAVIKETKIILRDREALLVLFVMPLAFVLIMSLAMRDAFREEGGVTFDVIIHDLDGGRVGDELEKRLGHLKNIKVNRVKGLATMTDEGLKKDLASGKYSFAIKVPEKVTERALKRVDEQFELFEGSETGEVALSLLSDPALRGDHVALVSTSINRVLQGVESGLFMERFNRFVNEMGIGDGTARNESAMKRVFSEVEAKNSSINDGKVTLPSSVQQSVPAYSLFAMFFLVIPLSGAFIKEREQGSLLRLQVMPAPAWIHLAGKIVPYFFVNQVQVLLMFLAGIFLVPLLGGDSLQIGNSYVGILMITFSASIAAIGFGLMVSVFSRTSEQATTFGGTSVIILSAIGGIMVPKFLMPDLMQKVAELSPLSWGLEGLLDIFVRGGGAVDVLPETGLLLGFAMVTFTVALWRYRSLLK